MQMSWRNMQMRKLLLFFPPHGGQITGIGWGQWSLSRLSPLCHPLCSFHLPPSLCCTLNFFPPFFKAHSPVTGFQLQLLLVSLLSEKSTSLEASYQNLLQQGGWLKLSGMTCGLAGSGGGDKCMANLWNIWIKGRVARQGRTMWWHGKRGVLPSTVTMGPYKWEGESFLYIFICFTTLAKWVDSLLCLFFNRQARTITPGPGAWPHTHTHTCMYVGWKKIQRLCSWGRSAERVRNDRGG